MLRVQLYKSIVFVIIIDVPEAKSEFYRASEVILLTCAIRPQRF